MADTTYPVPIGIGASFSPVEANIKTATFYMPPGQAVVTFQPADPNNAGTLTLFNDDDTSILTMVAPGYSTWVVPGETGIETDGEQYYFSCTQRMNLVAMTVPSVWR